MNHEEFRRTGVFQNMTITEIVLPMGIDAKQGQAAATGTPEEFPTASLTDWEKAASKAAPCCCQGCCLRWRAVMICPR